MRETRLSGSEGGAGSIPVPTPIADIDPADFTFNGIRPGESPRNAAPWLHRFTRA